MSSMDHGSTRTRRVGACASGSAAFAAVIVLSAGCSNLKMAVPEELARVSEELPITGRSRFAGLPGVNESFRIGSYEITDVDRDSEIAGSVSILGHSHKHIQGGYSYLFRGSKNQLTGECVISADKRGLSAGGPVSVEKALGTLGCVCRGSNLTMPLSYTTGMGTRAGGEWALGAGKSSRGKLRAAGRHFSIKMVSSTEGTSQTYKVGEGWKKNTATLQSLEPTGLLVYGGGPAGGLELLRPGRAWLARSLSSSQREAMACLFGGLVLYESPSGGNR